jgi:hypothetical protein
MFNDVIYEGMWERDEMWYCWKPGFAFIINDLPIWDS